MGVGRTVAACESNQLVSAQRVARQVRLRPLKHVSLTLRSPAYLSPISLTPSQTHHQEGRQRVDVAQPLDLLNEVVEIGHVARMHLLVAIEAGE